MFDQLLDYPIELVIFPAIFSIFCAILFYSFRRDLPRSFVLKRIEIGEKKALRAITGSISDRYKNKFLKRIGFIDAVLPLMITLIFVIFLYLNYIFFAVVASDSMKPLFERGDLVLMHGFNRTPEIGDIVLYKTSYISSPVVHRVVGFQKNYVQTKGDAVSIIDSWPVKKSDVQAKAVIIAGKPVVIPDVGVYLIMDYRDTAMASRYGETFMILSNLIKVSKSLSLPIFLAAIMLYLALTRREIDRNYE